MTHYLVIEDMRMTVNKCEETYYRGIIFPCGNDVPVHHTQWDRSYSFIKQISDIAINNINGVQPYGIAKALRIESNKKR